MAANGPQRLPTPTTPYITNQPFIPKCNTVSVLGQDEGYMVKYTPLSEGVPEGEAQGKSLRQRGIFDRISQVES